MPKSYFDVFESVTMKSKPFPMSRDILLSLVVQFSPWFMLHENSVPDKLVCSFILVNIILFVVCFKSQLPPVVSITVALKIARLLRTTTRFSMLKQPCGQEAKTALPVLYIL